MDNNAMTLWILTTFILKGVLADHWSVKLPLNPVCAVVGSTVILPCSYDYPEDYSSQPSHRVLSEMWCRENSRCITQSYVFHSAGIFLDPAYSNRVEYLGQPGTKNCSLQISGVKMSDSGAYVFYITTSHPTQKMPPQTGVHLLVAASPDEVTASVSPCGAVTKGKPLQLACCSPAASQVVRYTWFMDYARTNATKREYLGQVWTINEAQANTSGTYVCQVQYAEGLRNSTDITVDVQYPPQNTVVTALPDGGQTKGVALICSSDANPAVHSYTWYQGTVCRTAPDRMTEAASIGQDQMLHTNQSTGDSEVYCCVARNTLGSERLILNRDVDGEFQLSPGRQRWLIVGGTTVTILALVGIVAFGLRWKLKPPSMSQSYALTGTAD